MAIDPEVNAEFHRMYDHINRKANADHVHAQYDLTATNAAVASLNAADAAAAVSLVTSRRLSESLAGKVQVTDGCYGTATTAVAISTVGTYEFFYTVGMDASELQVGFGQWSETAAGNPKLDLDGSTSVTFSAAVRDAAGNVFGLNFGGARSWTLGPGGFRLSDPISVDVAQGDVIFVRVFISSGSGYWNRTAFKNASILNLGGFTATTDLTATAAGSVTNVTSSGWGPMCIIGTPRDKTVVPKAVVIQGDSIAAGSFDGIYGSQYVGYSAANAIIVTSGYLSRALSGVAGVINCALGGDRIQDFVAPNGHFRRAALAAFARYAIIEYGVNDIGNSRTAAQIQADLLTLANRNLAKGIVANILTTITPQSTSTDRFNTTANQTTSANNAARITHNGWVRDGGPIDTITKAAVATGTSPALRFGDAGHPIKGYVEVADVVESARDSGKFKIPDRVVTDAAATATTATMTSATAAFTSADIGRAMIIPGAGSAAADLPTTISAINSGTSVAITDVITTTVSAKTVGIGVYTADGVHPRYNGHAAIAAAIQAPLLALLT